MNNAYVDRNTYKVRYEKLLKKWQAEIVKVKILSDLNKGLTEQIKLGITKNPKP